MEEKHKVAIIAGQLVVGGAEKQLYLWLKHMDRTLFDPVVLTLHPGHGDYWEKPIEDLEIPLLRIPQAINPGQRAWSIIRQLRPFKPDLIHGWHLFSSPYAGVGAKVLNCSSLGSHRDSYNIFTQSGRVGKLAIKLTDGMLVNSITAAGKIRLQFPRRWNRIFSVQNALLDDYLERSRAREKLSEEFEMDPKKTWVGSIGRLDQKKRFDLLLKVISKIEDDSFQFIIIGDGPEMHELSELSIELDIAQKVHLVGEIPNAASYLKAFDVFTFTSFDEGLPNVILEAAAAGLPIIAWDLSFNKEVITDHKQGFLVPTGDIQAFTSTLSNLLINPQIRLDVGSKATASIIETFSLERYIRSMAMVYDSLLTTKY